MEILSLTVFQFKESVEYVNKLKLKNKVSNT